MDHNSLRSVARDVAVDPVVGDSGRVSTRDVRRATEEEDGPRANIDVAADHDSRRWRCACRVTGCHGVEQSAGRDVEVAPDGDVARRHVARPCDENGAVGARGDDAAVGPVAGVAVAEERRRVRMIDRNGPRGCYRTRGHRRGVPRPLPSLRSPRGHRWPQVRALERTAHTSKPTSTHVETPWGSPDAAERSMRILLHRGLHRPWAKGHKIKESSHLSLIRHRTPPRPFGIAQPWHGGGVPRCCLIRRWDLVQVTGEASRELEFVHWASAYPADPGSGPL